MSFVNQQQRDNIEIGPAIQYLTLIFVVYDTGHLFCIDFVGFCPGGEDFDSTHTGASIKYFWVKNSRLALIPLGQKKIISKSGKPGLSEKVISKDNFQNILRNLTPFCREFIALSDIFGSSDRNFTIFLG